MRGRPFILGLAVGWFGLPFPAWAILLVEKAPGSVPVGGYLAADDGATLKVKMLLPDGKELIKTYDLSKIEIIHKLDARRLQKLDKSDPKAYYDYAEELADKKLDADPEAKDTARRLFLIAAYLDRRQFGRGALLRMSSLAASEAEARRCRALAFLLDPTADAGALKAAPTPKAPADALQDFEKALQAYRTGLVANAQKLAASKDVDKAFGLAPGPIDKATFLQWCADAGASPGTPPPEDRLRKILQAEVWVIGQLSGDAGDKTGAGEAKWSSILQTRQVKPVSPLSLETIADDVDPRLCLYRDGKWVAP
jgi:hypothetical protein